MKKFFKIFFAFVLLILTLSEITDYFISKGLRKSDLRKYQAWNDIYDSQIKSDIIIMGSSRAWTQYNTFIIDSILHVNSYNLGIDGNPFNYQLIRYNTYRRFCHKPKVIIQNIDFSTLDVRCDGYEREQYFPFVFDDSLLNVVAGDKDITLIDRYIPLIRYYGYHDLIEDGLQAYFGKKQFFDGGMHKGYRGNNYSWDGSKLNKIDSIVYSKNPVIIKSFEEYLRRSKDENIQVIFVSAPVYFKALRKIKNLNQMNRMFNDLAAKYNLKLLDYTNDSICYDTKYFYNAIHLNKKGAEKFSEILAHDLKKFMK